MGNKSLAIFYKCVHVLVSFFIDDGMGALDGSPVADFKKPGTAHRSGLSRGLKSIVADVI